MSTHAAGPLHQTGRGVLADTIPGARARDVAVVVAGALFTALMAQVTVPMHPVPMTGQTLAVGVVGASLGMRRGVASMTLYVLAGWFLPVYADGAHGIDRLWGVTGGYLVGFVVAAAFIGWLAERGADRRMLTAFLPFVGAQLLVFVPGVVVLHAVVADGYSWSSAIHDGFTVFILGGLVKAAVGAVVLPSAWELMRRIDNR